MPDGQFLQDTGERRRDLEDRDHYLISHGSDVRVTDAGTDPLTQSGVTAYKGGDKIIVYDMPSKETEELQDIRLYRTDAVGTHVTLEDEGYGFYSFTMPEYDYSNKTVNSVKLSGRKLWKDGNWNTLCLPFAINDFTDTPLEGATVKTLESTSFSGGTLTLNFSENSLTAIEAGKPYIVKWTATTPNYVEDPVFNNVTIKMVSADVETDVVTFTGTYAPVAFTTTNKSVLFLGSGNTLYYPDPALKDPDKAYDATNNPYIPVTIGCQRAYFQLNGITEGGNAFSRFVLNFGEGETSGIVDAEANSSKAMGRRDSGNLFTLHSSLSEWYNLDGRRVANGQKPKAKGLYINNGKKVVIK